MLVYQRVTILKNIKVNGKDYPIYEMEIEKMFQTTNQGKIWGIIWDHMGKNDDTGSYPIWGKIWDIMKYTMG